MGVAIAERFLQDQRLKVKVIGRSNAPLIPILCGAISLYLVVEGFHPNFPQMFIMGVAVAEKVFNIRGPLMSL